jgi:NAD(P)-dependent dehydrogenase (short-subunit alcohol dehydrogenase family)
MPIITPLVDANVLVTGGASGIGRGIVEAFAGQGARVFFLDIDEDQAAACVESCSSARHTPQFRRCDLRAIEELSAAVLTLESSAGAMAVLVNNAGNDTRAPLSELSVEAWDEMMAVNLRHVVFASQAVA